MPKQRFEGGAKFDLRVKWQRFSPEIKFSQLKTSLMSRQYVINRIEQATLNKSIKLLLDNILI